MHEPASAQAETPELTQSTEFHRGWKLVLAACAGVICSSIVLPYYSIGALVVPVTAEFDWTRAQFQTAILFSAGLGALTAPLVGILIDRFGARTLALLGLVGLGASFFIAASMNGELWMLYLAYGSMALLGAGTIPTTWTHTIAAAFTRQRGLALGLALSGTGICAMLAPQFTVFLESRYGWRVAYMGLGLVPLLFALPLVYAMFRPNESRQQSAPTQAEPAPITGQSLGEAIRDHRFWVLLCSIFLAYLAVSGISPNLIPALTDDGFSSAQAASVQSVLGGSIIMGRLVAGYLVDRFWAPGVAAVALSLPVLGALLLMGAPSFPTALASALLIGLAAGAELDLMAFLTARYFGLRHYAKIYSVLYAVLAIAGGFAPLLLAAVFDFTGSYDVGFGIAACCFTGAAAFVLMMGRYPKAAT